MSSPDFLYDDAYITLQSAAVLWVGHDPHYQGATALHGITSPFHLLIVASLVRLLPPEWALLTSCLMGTAFYAAGLAALGRLEGLSRMLTAAVVLIGMGTGVAIQHHVNGLETSWTMAAVCWSLVLVRRDRPIALAALCGVLPFVRPELAVWSVALLGWSGLKHPSRFTVSILVAMATAAPWAVWLWSATGNIVPTTLAAKRDWYAESCWPLERRLSVVGRGLALWAAFSVGAIAGIVGLFRTGVGRMAIGTMFVIITVWSLNVPSVLYAYQHHRYFAPMLVFLAFGVCRLPARVRRPLALGGAVAALITSIATLRLEPDMMAAIGESRSKTVEQLRLMKPQRLMLHDAGYLAWADAAPMLIDMVGLKSPDAAALHAQLTAPSCGAKRAEALAELARRTRPDVLVVWEPWDQLFGVTAALREAGWSAAAPILVGTGAPVAIYNLQPPAHIDPTLSPLRQ